MSAVTSNATEKQTRIQSPSYPNIPLKEAIVLVGKIEARYRSSPADRADAAKLLGYTGLTGPANMALAALTWYGLTDRAGKGEIRVTERARSILHPRDEAERKQTLREAALSPALYRDLRERFGEMLAPPEEGVITYLNRQGFNPAAVRPAARAFLQTMSYMQELGVFESSGHADEQRQESPPQAKREESHLMQTAMPASPVPTTPTPPPILTGDLTLNEPNLSIRGRTVRVEALLDFDGLTELEAQIKALKTILKPRRSPEPDITDRASNE